MSEPPSNPYDRPITDATITVRVIKSFPYRTCKNIILHNLDLTALSSGELKARTREHVRTQAGWKAYRNVQIDSLKLYAKAHGTKTQNLIINLEDKDDALLFRDDAATLASYGCEHETEISAFNLKDYEEYKANPVDKW